MRGDDVVRAVRRRDVMRVVTMVEVVRLRRTLDALGADDWRSIYWRSREEGSSWKTVGKLERSGSFCARAGLAVTREGIGRGKRTFRLGDANALDVEGLFAPQGVAALALSRRATFLLDLEERTIAVRAIGRAMTLEKHAKSAPRNQLEKEGAHLDARRTGKLDSCDERHVELVTAVDAGMAR